MTLQFALAGASTVIISGRNVAPLEDTKSAVEAAAPACQVVPIAADVIDKTSVQQLFDRLPRTPDVLVNNAGVSLCQASIVDSDIDLWWSDWVSASLHSFFLDQNLAKQRGRRTRNGTDSLFWGETFSGAEKGAEKGFT